jgi:hypothetical protein
MNDEINPDHGNHKIVRAISKHPIHLEANPLTFEMSLNIFINEHQ